MFGLIPPQLNQPYPSLMYNIQTQTSQQSDFVCRSLNQIREDNSIAFSLQTPEERFNSLSETWKQDTINFSSLNLITSDTNYLQIISMGKKVLPLIVNEMQKEPNHWFVALNAITGVNPIQEQNRGNIAKMTEDWFSWLKSNYVTRA